MNAKRLAESAQICSNLIRCVLRPVSILFAARTHPRHPNATFILGAQHTVREVTDAAGTTPRVDPPSSFLPGASPPTRRNALSLARRRRSSFIFCNKNFAKRSQLRLLFATPPAENEPKRTQFFWPSAGRSTPCRPRCALVQRLELALRHLPPAPMRSGAPTPAAPGALQAGDAALRTAWRRSRQRRSPPRGLAACIWF